MRAVSFRLVVAALVAGGVVTCSLNAQQPATEVTAQDLRDGLKNSTRWLTYSGNYANHRHSPLTQITPENVHRLTAVWQFQTDTLGKFEATPLVLDGVVYVTGPLDTGWAIDARTGRQIWRYRRDLPSGLVACCGLVNRGFGVLGDRLFKTTLDAHVVAISRKTGALEWDTASISDGGYVITAVARNTAGAIASSEPVSVVVANGNLWISPLDTELGLDAINRSGEPTLSTTTWPDNQPASAIALKFDLAQVPAGAMVYEATLHMALLDADASAEPKS